MNRVELANEAMEKFDKIYALNSVQKKYILDLAIDVDAIFPQDDADHMNTRSDHHAKLAKFKAMTQALNNQSPTELKAAAQMSNGNFMSTTSYGTLTSGTRAFDSIARKDEIDFSSKKCVMQ